MWGSKLKRNGLNARQDAKVVVTKSKTRIKELNKLF